MDRLTLGLMIAFGVLAVVTAILAFVIVRNLVLSWDITDLPGVPKISLPQKTAGASGGSVPLQPVSGPTPQPWDGKSRVNILFMGLDYRDWEAGETPRTDTMILFTIDPISKTAGMLSIPRDMWVSIPGHEHGRINTAYFLGEVYKLPGGGPGLAAKTVEHFLGVPVHFYAQVDFMAFVRFIDEMECLNLHVREEIRIGRLHEPDSIVLEEGVMCYDGMSVLGYARARNSEGSDFDRARRQQEVIMAIREQILTFDMLPTLIAKAPALYVELSSGIRTNMSLNQLIQLAVLATQIEDDGILRGVIAPPKQVDFGTSPDGQMILIPIPDQIRLLRDEIFTTGGPVGPAAVASDPSELIRSEQARISVQNGSLAAGLANRTGEYFRSMGLNVVEETNADRVYENTTLVIMTGKPYTTRYLADLMGVASGDIYNRYDPDASADLIIIVGNDWANNNPMP